MTTPRLLSGDEMETVTLVAETQPNARWATASVLKLLGHIAALGADNAALLDGLSDAVPQVGDYFREKYGLDAILAQPHPGAALLEEHRKALVRARNDGMEKAAQYFDKAASLWASFHAGEIAAQHAKAIRAMKEPE